MSDDYKPGNPQYHVDAIMESAVIDAFERIRYDIDEGKLTREEARAALDRNWDLGDFFEEGWEDDD